MAEIPPCVGPDGAHHWHEVDTTIFNRERKLAKRDVIAVTCCWCATTATKTGYGDRNPVTPSVIWCNLQPVSVRYRRPPRVRRA